MSTSSVLIGQLTIIGAMTEQRHIDVPEGGLVNRPSDGGVGLG